MTELINEHCAGAPHEIVDIQPHSHYLDDITGYSTSKLQRAFYDEFQKLTEKELYEEVHRTSLTPEQQKSIVKTGWVVSDRPGTSGEDILEARFVAKGYSQYVTSDTFAATPASTPLRVMLMLSIISSWNVTSCDISSAFINTPLKSDIIWRLRKAMCGLKNESTSLAEAPHIGAGEHRLRLPAIPSRAVQIVVCSHPQTSPCSSMWTICSSLGHLQQHQTF